MIVEKRESVAGSVPEQPPSYATLQPDFNPYNLSQAASTSAIPIQHSASNSLIPASASANNYLSLSRTHTAIKGTYIIDPSLIIPAALLPPLAEKEQIRSSLKFATAHGKIDVDVFLIGDRGLVVPYKAADPCRTRLEFGADHGSVNVRLHTSPINPRPIHLMASCKHNSINLELPPTFHGLLTVHTTHSSVNFSQALLGRQTVLSDAVNGAHRYFLGDLTAWTGEQWLGDEMEIMIKHGRVNLKVVNEKKGSSDEKSRLKEEQNRVKEEQKRVKEEQKRIAEAEKVSLKGRGGKLSKSAFGS